ncbi:hypothetical protein [Nitrosomonas sp.]|uniref:hypothetical protein n=1 Tax=Nitrosomonas sp. TaxID=42353 RepID=UPI00374CBD21
MLNWSLKVSNRGYNGEELRMTAEQRYDFSGIRSRFAKQIRIHYDPSTLNQVSNLKTALAPFSNQTQKPYLSGNHSHPACPITVIYHNELASGELELGND